MPTALLDSVVLKALTSRDVPKVRELHSKILPVHYPSSFFLQLLLLPNRACFVAYERGYPNTPIGFISAARQQPISTLDCFTCNSGEKPPPVSSRLQEKVPLDVTKPRLEILTLGVLPAYQQCGLARRLVQCIIDNFRQSCAGKSSNGAMIFANVSTSNTAALKFYEHMGMSVSSDVISNVYRTSSYGCKDAYIVMGILYE